MLDGVMLDGVILAGVILTDIALVLTIKNFIMQIRITKSIVVLGSPGMKVHKKVEQSYDHSTGSNFSGHYFRNAFFVRFPTYHTFL